MNEEFLDIKEFVSAREPALTAALEGVQKGKQGVVPFHRNRTSASPFRFKRMRIRPRSGKKAENYKLFRFYSKRYSMKDTSSIFPGIEERLPTKRNAQRMRCIGRVLRHGALFYDVTPFCAVAKKFSQVRCFRQLEDYQNSLTPIEQDSTTRYIEVLSKFPSIIERLGKKIDVIMSPMAAGKGCFRSFCMITKNDRSDFLRKADAGGFGVESLLIGFDERRWVSLQIREPFDARDIRCEYFCVSISKGVPVEGQPFYRFSETSSCESPIETESSRKCGIVTYGCFHEEYRRGAGFLHLTKKSPAKLQRIRIGDNIYKCYPVV